MRIQIADDDFASLKLLEATLRKLGHEVTCYEDGVELWNSFDLGPPQVVVSDWLMPTMDGLELCRRIRSQKAPSYTYFILLTANPDNRQNYREAMESGVDDFLVKPLDKDSIWMRLRVAERILGYASRISALESIIPICSYCKRVREDSDYWKQVESYVTDMTGARFSHSICPKCYEEKVKPELEQMARERKALRGAG